MKYLLFCIVASAMILVGSAQAQLVYDFEDLYNGAGVLNGPAANRPDGFEPIGLSLAQSTTGATLNTYSMQLVMPNADFFDAARDDTPNTPGTDPNSVLFKASAVTYDLTINAADPQFGGGFADLGVTAFYANNTDPANETFGNQLQSSGFANVALAPGLYHQNIAMMANDPISGNPETFGQIFSNPNLIPTGFQFFLNKSTGAGTAITVYLDNVNAVVPEPATMLGACSAIGLLLRRNRRAR